MKLTQLKIAQWLSGHSRTENGNSSIALGEKDVGSVPNEGLQHLKIAVAQRQNGRDLKSSASLAVKCCESAKNKGAEILVFPEMWSHNIPKISKTDGYFNINKNKSEFNKWSESAVLQNSDYFNTLRKAAKNSNITVVATCLFQKDKLLYNTAFVFGPNGNVITQHNKIHTRKDNHEFLLTSGSSISTFSLKSVKFAILIGEDHNHSECFEMISLSGVDVVLISSNQEINEFKITQLQVKSIETNVFLVLANYPGKNKGKSCVLSPEINEGSIKPPVLLMDEVENEVMVTELNLDVLKASRESRRNLISFRKPEIYSQISSQIILVEHNTLWPEEFKKIKSNLTNILKEEKIKIEHVGSTSLTIKAKPIIDIDVIVENETILNNIKRKIENSEIYEFKGNFGIENRDVFYPRYLADLMDHHIYLAIGESDRVIFRDSLSGDPQILKKYEKLKIRLADYYKFDIKEYTLAKSEFFQRVVDLVKNPNDKELRDYRISSDKTEMNAEDVKRLLDQSWWGNGHSVEKIRRNMKNSICFGVFNSNDLLVGYAKVVTDLESFYYLWDFIIDKNYRKRGLGTRLMKYIVEYKRFAKLSGGLCSGVKKFYEQFGFIRRDNAFMCKDVDDKKS